MSESSSLSPSTRELACRCDLPVELIPTSVRWNERLGRPFEATVVVITTADDLDPTDWIGQPMGIIVGQLSDEPVQLHGIIDAVKQLDYQDEICRLEIRLVPWIGLLRYVGGCRIYQQQSVVDIITSITGDRGFSGALDDRLSTAYQPRTYCVQYNESDLDFISRLMEEEGIYYFFEYTESSHTMVLCDDVVTHTTVTGYAALPFRGTVRPDDPAGIGDWTSERQFTTASIMLDDYDFQKPRVDLSVRQEASPTPRPWWRSQYPGRFFDSERGQQLSRVQSEATVCHGQTIGVRSNLAAIHSGNRVSVTDHPNDTMNRDYIITSASLNIDTGELSVESDSPLKRHWFSDWTLQPADVPFRLRQETQRPPMIGPQVATVVGPEDQEIWTDSFGRVKIQFAWDQLAAGDDGSSCWVRVTQGWTGQNYGMMSVPRVGEEVTVQFFNGDLDRPVITGRIFNASMMPPDSLPGNQAKTIMRTRSTPDGNAETFHELTFDDTKDAEAILLHSERDFVREVENNDSLKVGFDKQDPGDQTIDVFHDRTIQAGGKIRSQAGEQLQMESGDDMSMKSAKALSVDSDDAMSLTAGDTQSLKSGNAMTVESGAALSIKSSDGLKVNAGSDAVIEAGTELTISAATKLTLSCGGSQIVLDPSTVTIKGAMVMIN